MGSHTRFAAGALLAFGLLLAAATGAGAADAYPSRPIRIIVPYAVGGATDLITRVVAQSLSQSLGVGVVVENRAGGGGTVASKAVSLAEPDGYTLLTATNGPFAIGPAVYPNVGYDPIKSFAPIAYLAGAQANSSRTDVSRNRIGNSCANSVTSKFPPIFVPTSGVTSGTNR